MHEATDLHRVLGALHQARAALELDTAHLCYLIALRVRSERSNLASLTEDQLVDLYLQVCELIEPDAVNPRKRATHAIQHLRDHRLLRRVDGAGLVRAGEYTLTRLAVAIVDFFVEDETLTRESLVVLTRALTSQLGAVLADARKAETEEAWRTEVAEPLRVTVSDRPDPRESDRGVGLVDPIAARASSSKRRDFNPATAKYDFRVFLLKLGLIGDEFKTAPLHLMARLEGSAAWKGERRDTVAYRAAQA